MNSRRARLRCWSFIEESPSGGPPALISLQLMDISDFPDILCKTTACLIRHESRLSGTFLIDSFAQL